MSITLRYILAITTLALGLCGQVSAEQKTTVGNFDIHYIAFNSTFLTPSIAKAYKLERSSYKGIINIAVLKNNTSDGLAVPVEISGVANNLLDTPWELTFTEIREGDAIYYLAEVPYRNDEQLRFNIAIKHNNQLNTQLKFKHTFFVQ